MKTFLQPFLNIPDINKLKELLGKKENEYYGLSGVADRGKAHVIYGITEKEKHCLLIAQDELEAKEIYDELSFFRKDVYYFPPKDLLFFQSDIRGNALTKPRVQTLAEISKGKSYFIVATVESLITILQEKKEWEKGIQKIKEGDTIIRDSFVKNLINSGYENVYQVEHQGDYSVRGDIIDIYPITEEQPVRIELWDDEIDLIKRFDAETQKSIERIKKVNIYPACEFVLDSKTVVKGVFDIKNDLQKKYEELTKKMKKEEAFHLKENVDEAISKIEEGWIRQEGESYLTYFLKEKLSLLDFIDDDTVILFDDSKRIEEFYKNIVSEYKSSMERRVETGFCLKKQNDILISENKIKNALKKHTGVSISILNPTSKWVSIKEDFHIKMEMGLSFNGSFETLVRDIKKYKNKNYKIVIVAASSLTGKRLVQNLMDLGIISFYTKDRDKEVKESEVMVTNGNMSRGFSYTDSKFVFISEGDIFGSRRPKKKRKKLYDGIQIETIRDLSIGDYVVHENHGIGIYRGMEKIEIENTMKDFLKIEYAQGAKLYVPATQFSCVQKYGMASSGDRKPRLNSLSGREWHSTKSRVEKAVGEIAKELVSLYALRQNDMGYCFPEDTMWQKEFEEKFPYEETEGQLNAIHDVKNDMESHKIMDRLICGDVGYGKTEVALRAAFKAVQESKQVAYLVPTTILAEQHYNTFVSRMKDFSINIVLLSRFKTSKEIKESIKKLSTGEADIAIGTHRLLSKDVKFKDLGLLIIDEEQRFGVSHKEKIKQLKKNVDVISMSATPIPRTLHMSLSGIRDMSLLSEPPRDRQPIQTFVFEYDDEIVREAIEREVKRGGQVYYVINQIKNIDATTNHLRYLIPGITIEYAHGRMNEKSLEDIMHRFINKEIDVLVSTTIIEIGMDITNVNTIIIHDADRMGLSQLYQLRGRVGRGNRTAYAFFLYKKDKILKDDAEKRLAAIREFSELGSGFKIAMRDLEIRGAGNMLGKEQHGHMAAVGYDLYCKMLNTALRKEKGEEVADFTTLIDINMDAYIPKDYITKDSERINIYKRIASIETSEEKEEIEDELLDRFGEPRKAVLNLCDIAVLKALCHKAYITEAREKEHKITIKIWEKAKLSIEGVKEIFEDNKNYLTFSQTSEGLEFIFDTKKDSRISLKSSFSIIEKFAENIIDKALCNVE